MISFDSASAYGILVAWKDVVPKGCTLWENQGKWVERLCRDIHSSSDGIRTFNILDRFILISTEDIDQSPTMIFLCSNLKAHD
jgi:hypothetical protein